tara:strand:- start:2700 stop:2966 length:267 start_codon:yes stop_codon:yes gene_type:complete
MPSKRGGYITSKDKLYEFVVISCETCHRIGAMQGTLKQIPKDKGVHMIFETRPTTIYFKERENGEQYEPLCGECSDKISLVEVEKAIL